MSMLHKAEVLHDRDGGRAFTLEISLWDPLFIPQVRQEYSQRVTGYV